MDKTVPLKKNFEFVRIYKKGKFFVGKYIVLYIMKNNTKLNRLGITANKKVDGSVKRNRLRRLLKESYRHIESFVKDGFDLVFVARNSDVMAGYNDISREMKFLLKRLDVFVKEIRND